MKLNETNIPNLNLKGQGGKENEFSKILDTKDGWVRRNNDLYDYQNTLTNQLVEIKKQQDQQWFDPAKYANLSDDEKDIIMLFCLIDNLGKVNKIFTVNTKDFISRNFTQEFLNDSFLYKSKYSKTQLKESVSIKKFFRNNKDIINLIYEK